MQARIVNQNGHTVLEINGKRFPFVAPPPSVLTDGFTGERIMVDPDGTAVYFKPHETKFYTVQHLRAISS